MDDIYQEQILDHYKHPQNFGEIEECNCKQEGAETAPLRSEQNNPMCGDQLEMSICLKDGKIDEVKFNGQGCAVSMASASMLTEKIKGMSLEEVKKVDYADIEKMLGIPLSSSRKKCAYLGLEVLKKVIGA